MNFAEITREYHSLRFGESRLLDNTPAVTMIHSDEWDKFIAPFNEGKDYAKYFKNACAGSTEDISKMLEQYTKLVKLQ